MYRIFTPEACKLATIGSKRQENCSMYKQCTRLVKCTNPENKFIYIDEILNTFSLRICEKIFIFAMSPTKIWGLMSRKICNCEVQNSRQF